VRREELLDELQKLKATSKDSLIEFKNKLCDECYPTYFNLMKAMYPLLADAYYLNQVAYGEDKAGESVGFFGRPLEEAISEVQKGYGRGTPERRVADLLQEKINTTPNTSFFGDWGS
jgi:hypothetical protein